MISPMEIISVNKDASRNFFLMSSRSYEEELTFSKKVKEGFSVINAYLWVHGIGFTRRLRFTAKGIAVSLLSFLLAAIFDGSMLYICCDGIVHYYSKQHKTISKTTVSGYCIVLLTLTTRILFYFKRRQLSRFNKELIKISSKLRSTKETSLSLKYHAVVVCVITDAFVILVVIAAWAIVLRLETTKEDNWKDILTERPLFDTEWSPALSCWLYYWGAGCPFAVVHFCQTCRAINQIIRTLNDNYLQFPGRRRVLVRVFDDVIRSTGEINRVLHAVLLTNTAFILLVVFRNMYKILFLPQTSSLLLFSYSCLVGMRAVSWFVLLCAYGSAVRNSASELKEAIQDLPADLSDLYGFGFALKINERFVGFRLLSSIVIDSSFILTALGTMLTYGILIASL